MLANKIKSFGKRVLRKLGVLRTKLPYTGPFETWELAVASAVGYDSAYALKKVRDGILSVLKNEMSYERDGTVFEKMPEKYTLRSQIKSLLSSDSVIIDFGGGLGGTFVNNQDLFTSDWNGDYYVVEQTVFCEEGSKISKMFNLPVRFVDDLSQISDKPHILIFSGVLQYIPDWRQVVSIALQKKPPFIVIDRQPLTNAETQIYVQENDGYYESKVSYPSRIINKSEFLSVFDNYEVIEEWYSDFDPADHIGFLLKAIE